jgi:hypothetical protein
MLSLYRRLAVVVSVGTFVLALPAAGLAVTRQHVRSYERAYHAVSQKYGHRAPGRDIVRWGTKPRGRPATDAQVTASLAVLHRMLAPPPPAVSGTVSSSAPGSSSYAAAPSSGLASCIISRESGGNTQATNGQYSGIAQWSPSSWAGGGGTAYASSPTGATYAQQVQVLNNMLANGQASQWTPYDGC